MNFILHYWLLILFSILYTLGVLVCAILNTMESYANKASWWEILLFPWLLIKNSIEG